MAEGGGGKAVWMRVTKDNGRISESRRSFSLNQTIGSSYPADPDDVLRTKKGLRRLGFYAVPKEYGMDPWTDDELFDGLKNFQRDNDLAVDGIMKPGGPTQSILGRRLSGRKDERDLMPKTFAPLSGLGKGERNREEDVLGLRRGLAGLGLMPRGEAGSENPLFDSPLEKAIRNLQEKFGLKEDGIIRPKGPTQEVFERLLAKNRNEFPAKPHVFSTVPVGSTGDREEPAPNLLQQAQAVKAKAEDAGDTESGQRSALKLPPKPTKKPPPPEDTTPGKEFEDAHDVWRGTTKDMSKVLGVDPDLAEKAGPDIAVTLSGVAAYRFLDSNGRDEVDERIQELKKNGHPELSEQLGKTRRTTLYQRQRMPISMSVEGLHTGIELNEKIGSILDKAKYIPKPKKVPLPAYIGTKLMLDQVKAGLKKEIEGMERELERRGK